VGLGYFRAATASGWLAWGARASWSTATEYTLIDTVRNDDIRCAFVDSSSTTLAVVRSPAPRRGATAVYENVTASQGSRAGLTGSALETTKWYLLPAADLEGVVFLRVCTPGA